MNKPVLKALAAAAFACCAVPTLALDLMGAYTQAAAFDPTLQAAGDALRAGREKTLQGRALLLPQVQLSANVMQLDQRTSTSSSSTLPPQLAALNDPDSSGRANEVALEARQPLVNAKSRAEKKQLEQQTALAELRHRDAQQELMQRVAESYLHLLLAEESLQVARAEKAAVALQRDRAQARFDVGRGRITELQEAQARLDAVTTREVSAQGQLALRQAQFQELTGARPEGLAPLRADFAPLPPAPADALAWQSQAAAGSTRVLAKQIDVAIAGFEIRKYELAARPTLDVVASYVRKGQSEGLSSVLMPERRNTAALGLQFNVPLFAGGAITSREREAVARHGQAQHELAAAQRDARLQAHDAYLAVTTGVSRIHSLSQSVRSAQTALEATTLGRDLGNRTELDVLDAQQRLFSTRLERAQARYDYLLARIKLAAATGNLQESDLVAINDLLAR